MFWYYIYRLKQQHIEDKVRFFTNTAHDIRTSLTLIKAPVEALRDEKNLSERGRQFIEMANEQAQRLNATVTQLMDFQKADIRKEKVFLTMVNLPEIISQRIGMFSSLAATKNIQIKTKFKTKHYESAVDIVQIEKVVDNLVSNAIKYSHNKSIVEVAFSADDKQWVLTVKDYGIGVSKRDQKLLFKEFFRAENAINSKIVGSGVGLLLVKNIVKLHDGEISFTSEENLGSIFTVIVPHKKLVDTNDEALSLLPNAEIIDGNDQIEPGEDFEKVSGENNNKAQKILIVEDNEDLMHFLRLSFVDIYDVSSAANGVEAWEKIQNELPDLVISDVMMPKMGGFELCKLVKSTFETSHVPVVLLTAFDDKAMQLRGLGFGADDYLTKPFDMGLLHQKIRSIIQNRTAVREKALRLIQTDQNAPVLNNLLNDEFLHTMLSVVKKNLDNPEFNKDDFARAMKVSGSLLYKKVKALTDLSPVDFIKSVRMGHALELLQKGGYSVTEVSDKCGYTSAGYFSTVFKKYYGKAPSEV
jgi:CheY-like chemotaxis protein/anti-sigma regulatory factor (Ser/Thr protein kinase)